MKEEVLQAVDTLVNTIYTPDQDGLAERFANLTEALISFVEQMQEAGYFVDLTGELTNIQNAFAMKDYVLLADNLLYELKPQFENLEI